MIILSKREWNILTFIQSFAAKNGITPSHYEIRNGCGISSTSTVAEAVEALRAHGLITKCQDKGRTIVLCGGTIGVRP